MTETPNVQQLDTNEPPKNKTIGLSELTLIGLVLGIGCGLFFGEGCAQLQIFGDAFVGLLQMTVLPYIVLSLVGGIGSLNLQQSKKLVAKAALVLLSLWALGLVCVALMSLAFPPLTTGSFFSTSLVEPPREFNFLELFIPSNPFNSLAGNKVPAVVIFCILLGVSIISLDDKQDLLRLVDLLTKAMSRVTKLVVKLSPLGVFFLSASATGTMTLSQLGRLQGYLIVYTAAALLLGFGLLPAAIAAVTPFRYRDLVRIAKDGFILAFAAGKVLVVLPLLIEGIKSLFQDYGLADDDTESTIEILVPLAFPFPHLGRLLTMSFIPFAAWYVGGQLAFGQFPVLLGAGFFSNFGSSTISIPFLLDLMRLPSDMFQLFAVTDVLVDRFSNALAATYLFTFTVVTTCAVRNLVQLPWRKIGIVAANTVLVGVLTLWGTRAYLGYVSQGAANKDQILANMQLLESPVSAVVVEPAPNPDPLLPDESAWSRIRRRGTIRIGFDADNLPWSFYNAENELVGFDIDMAHRLAREFNFDIEFVPFQFSSLTQQIRADHFDIAMS